jgi:hypothetical protein
MGLVNRVVPAAELEGAVKNITDMIAPTRRSPSGGQVHGRRNPQDDRSATSPA